MGACSSCLGRKQDHDIADEDEQSRLLFEDHHSNHYGSFGDHTQGIVQADPLEVQRENEALLKVVTQTSNHLVDIFAAPPQAAPSAPTTAIATHDARLHHYRDVLAKLSTTASLHIQDQTALEDGQNSPEGWTSEDDDMQERKEHQPIISHGVGPLLGRFSDPDLTSR